MDQNQPPTPDRSVADKRKLLSDLLRRRASQGQQRFEASPNQQAICFMQLLDPASPIYNLHSCIRVESLMYLDFLRATFQHLVDRHAMLRAVFQPGEVQSLLIRGTMEAPFAQIDASGWSDVKLTQQVHRAFAEPFDLEKGPLVRFRLFTRGPLDHVLLIVAHHLICDGWSLFLIRHEFREICRAAENGLPRPNFPVPPVEFWDYLRENKALLDGPAGQKLQAYWRTQLSGPVPPLHLYREYQRPLEHTGLLGEHHFVLDEKRYEKLTALAKAQGVTLFTVVFAAYQAMLARTSHQEDFLVGFPVSGRTRVEYEGVVGHFVNMVVLRCNLAGDPTFRELLVRTWTQLCGALANQEYPYCRLAPFLRSERSDPHALLTQVMINYLRVTQDDKVVDLHFAETDAPGDWGRPDVKPFPLKAVGERYDLALRLMDPGQKLFGRLQYNTDLFDPNAAGAFANGMVVLLDHAADQPDLPLSQYRVISLSQPEPENGTRPSRWWSRLLRFWRGS
jgi:hypothetical protein